MLNYGEEARDSIPAFVGVAMLSLPSRLENEGNIWEKARNILSVSFYCARRTAVKAFVQIYQGKGTFTLKRMMQDGRSEERSNIDVYNGDLHGYASEATLKWGDLVLDGVESKPRW